MKLRALWVLAFFLILSAPSSALAVPGYWAGGTCFADWIEAVSTGTVFGYSALVAPTGTPYPLMNTVDSVGVWQVMSYDKQTKSLIPYGIVPPSNCDTSQNLSGLSFDMPTFSGVFGWLMGLFVLSAGIGYTVNVFRRG